MKRISSMQAERLSAERTTISGDTAGLDKLPPPPQHTRPAVIVFLWIFVLLAMVSVIGSGGLFYFRLVTAAARKVATDNMTAVAESKVREIINWRTERLGDANILRENPFFAEAVIRWLANPEATNAKPLLTLFRSLQTHCHYSDVLLVDASGQVRLSLSDRRDRVHDDTMPVLAAALRDRRVMLTDLVPSSGNLPPRINVVVPVAATSADAAELRSAIIMQVDACDFLYPLIRAWPTASPSAETLLIRQDGNDVLYLNELRHRKGTAMMLRLPIVDKDLPAARAVRGETGEMTGVDYRGVPVLAHVRAVPDTKWFMVAKVDQSEINAPLHQQALLISACVGVLLIATGLGAGLILRHQRTLLYRNQVEALERLNEVNLRYSMLFQNMLNGFAYCRIIFEQEGPPDLVYLAVNTAFEKLTGLKNVVGKKISEIIPGIREKDLKLLETYGRVVRTGVPESFEVYVESLKKWLQLSVYRAGEGCFVAVFDVITDRKQAEELLTASEVRYRRLFEAARDGILILNAETGKVVDVNPFMIELLGVSREGFLGKRVWELGFFKDIVANEANFKELQAKQYIRYEDMAMEGHDGKRHEVEFVSNVYLADHQKVIQCNIRDISERVRSAAALRESALELQCKNVELERFLYAASHDLKSPVVTVRTFLGYLEEDMAAGDAGRFAKDLEFIRVATDKMARLLADLLKMSRIGRVVSASVKLTFHSLVADALGAVAGLIAQRNVTVKEHECDVTLCGDPIRLTEIFQNLIENSCKFMGDQKEPRIEIGVEEREAGHVFFVRDNGIGIDQRFQVKVFGLFEKLDPKAEGTGIGLALVKRIVELYAGRIWVESAGLGQGTCFYFTLPGAKTWKEVGSQ